MTLIINFIFRTHMDKLFILTLIILVLSPWNRMQAQQRIQLGNYSFENNGPAHSKTPRGWSFCGKTDNSPPDIHGYDTDFFEVIHSPQEGDNFLGLVARKDGTTESISQLLDDPLEKGKTYWFSLYMARTPKYKSVTLESEGELVNLSDTCRLQIWGGKKRCRTDELLGSSDPVEHENWIEYEFLFEPKDEWDYLTLEVSYDNPLKPENGHILIDNLSDIVEIIENESDSKISKYEKYELATLDAETIIQLANECVAYHSAAGYEYPISLQLINKVAAFHDQQSSNGLRSYIINHDMGDISSMIRILEMINVQAPTEVLKKSTLIYQTKKREEEVSEEDYQYFDNSDELFLESLQQESILDRLKAYINSNKTAITEDLSVCR
ncbi:MAG: hypothetical protein AAFP19_23075 [Bacteroidota bacterium]